MASITSPHLDRCVYTSQAIRAAVALIESNGASVKISPRSSGWLITLASSGKSEDECRAELLEVLNNALTESLEQRLGTLS